MRRARNDESGRGLDLSVRAATSQGRYDGDVTPDVFRNALILTGPTGSGKSALAVLEWLKSLRPAARVGTFVVYHLD